MKIDLAELARENGDRRPRAVMRPIEPTQALEDDLLRIYMESVRMWRRTVREVLLPLWEKPPSLVQDEAPTARQVERLINQADREINDRVIYQTERLGRWVTNVNKWHRQRTITAAKSATGVDISPFIRLGDVRELLDRSIDDNVSLIKNVNADTKRRVEQVMFDGFARRRTKREMTRELAKAMGITQRRARNIVTDQMHKLNSQLTQYRNEQMGISAYIWITRRDERVRHAHRLRQGKTFRWSKPPFDGHPGYPIMCRCSAESIIWDEDD